MSTTHSSDASPQHVASLRRGAPCQRNATESPYPDEVIRRLADLTSALYTREAASFSATRQTPWTGWEKAWATVVAEDSALAHKPLSILDLGCGNLRFERFLAEHLQDPVTVHALDNCAALAEGEAGATSLPDHLTVEFRETDLVEHLLDSPDVPLASPATCDLSVAFGIMHHLPTFALRAQALEGLLAALRPGGFAIVSFWQFMNDPRLAAKAEAATAEGRAILNLPLFGANDFLLGWQHAPGVYRFCHHTPDDEIDALLRGDTLRPRRTSRDNNLRGRCPAFREVARFSADGKQGNLNRYVVLQRSAAEEPPVC